MGMWPFLLSGDMTFRVGEVVTSSLVAADGVQASHETGISQQFCHTLNQLSSLLDLLGLPKQCQDN